MASPIDGRTISVVVPVYNSEHSLPPLGERLAAVLPTIATRWELILVNDGSRDGSWEAIRALATRYPWVRGIDMMRNYGQHNALLCGIRAARFETVVTMDDDLQHPPEEIEKLLAKLDEGYDVVYGTPEKLQHNFLRNLASLATKMALRGAMGTDVAGKTNAFRVFRTAVREAFAQYRSPFVSIDVLLTWGTTRFAAVPVRHEPRSIGQSNYTFRKLLTHAFTMMTGFSTLPLQLASWIGFGFTLVGVFVFLYALANYLIRGGSVPGFTFLAAAIALFSGAQLFALGLIGEYLARVHFRTMDKPSYTVRATEESAGAERPASARAKTPNEP